MIRFEEIGSYACSVADCGAFSNCYRNFSYNVYMNLKTFLLKGNFDKAEFKAQLLKSGAFAGRFRCPV